MRVGNGAQNPGLARMSKPPGIRARLRARVRMKVRIKVSVRIRVRVGLRGSSRP